MSIAEAGYGPPGGERVAEVGPLTTKAGTGYTAAYMEGIMLPGAVTGVHRHPGPEAIHTLDGQECMETPAGRFVGRPGDAPIVVPADVPHRLTITGTAERRSLALVLHDSPPALGGQDARAWLGAEGPVRERVAASGASAAATGLHAGIIRPISPAADRMARPDAAPPRPSCAP